MCLQKEYDLTEERKGGNLRFYGNLREEDDFTGGIREGILSSRCLGLCLDLT